MYDLKFKFKDRQELVPFIITDLPGKEQIYETYVKSNIPNIDKKIGNTPNIDNGKLKQEMAYMTLVMDPMFAPVIVGDDMYDAFMKINNISDIMHGKKYGYHRWGSVTNTDSFINSLQYNEEPQNEVKIADALGYVEFQKRNLAVGIMFTLISEKKLKELYMGIKLVNSFTDKQKTDFLLALEGYFIDENIVSLLKYIAEMNSVANQDKFFVSQKTTEPTEKFVSARINAYAANSISAGWGGERPLNHIVGATLNLLNHNKVTIQDSALLTVNTYVDGKKDNLTVEQIKNRALYTNDNTVFNPSQVAVKYYVDIYKDFHDAEKGYTFDSPLMTNILQPYTKIQNLRNYVVFAVVSNNGKNILSEEAPNKCEPQSNYILQEMKLISKLVS